MKAIVFGGSGFVGSHVADALSDAGHEVTVADVVPSQHLREGQRFVDCDVTDFEAVRAAVAGHDAVYHFAGFADIGSSRDQARETVRLNVEGTVNALEAARLADAKRFVFASTIYVVGESGSFYRVSKEAAELYVEEYEREYGLAYTILRFGTLYGRRADARNSIHRYLRQALGERKIVAFGTGDELREYIHVADAARLSVEILADEYANQHLILTGHHPLRFRELLTLIREIVGDDVELEVHAEEADEHLSRLYSGHYAVTPYAFRPRLTRKLVSTTYVDMGEGLIDVLHEIHGESAQQQQA
ncbi:MAG TPA: NAD(P)-dependent oxidoreductase [Gaiellaceae bacterium]|nr:NAD(P)-dependent oxidoreductase [Gaiellaceae bacterium]